MTLNIVDSNPSHVKELVKSLREKDRHEAIGLGLDPHKATYYANRFAIYRKTAIINDKIAAMWGLHGSFLGTTGRPYFITSNSICEINPLTLIRIYKSEVKYMLHLFSRLEGYVDSDYYEAIRLLKMCGFNVHKPIVVPTTNKMFRRFEID